jgi:hypothetical protein
MVQARRHDGPHPFLVELQHDLPAAVHRAIGPAPFPATMLDELVRRIVRSDDALYFNHSSVTVPHIGGQLHGHSLRRVALNGKLTFHAFVDGTVRSDRKRTIPLISRQNHEITEIRASCTFCDHAVAFRS